MRSEQAERLKEQFETSLAFVRQDVITTSGAIKKRHPEGLEFPTGPGVLCAIIHVLAPNSKTYAEIGVRYGHSILNVLNEFNVDRAFGVGDFRNYGRSTKRGGKPSPNAVRDMAMELRIDSSRIEIIQGNSHDDSTLQMLRSALQGCPLDILYIDGDHTENGCYQDWQMYSPLVADSGIVVFDNYAPPKHTTNGVIIATKRMNFGGRQTLDWRENFIVLPEGT